MNKYHKPLYPGRIYHVFSRAVGKEKVFIEERNYPFFLSRFQRHISPIAETYAYSLLPNDFNFLLRIKELDALKEQFNLKKPRNLFAYDISSPFIMKQFSNLLNSYVKSFNKMYQRKGALFIDYMRRVEVVNTTQLCKTALYIHNKALRHGYVHNIEDWKWNSFGDFLQPDHSFLQQQDLIKYFGGMKPLLDCHYKLEESFKMLTNI